MRFHDALDRYLADGRAEGRLRSEHTLRAYRECLELHAQDVGGRDPAKTGRRDVMRTLERWEHPNTRRQKHTILQSFYRWTIWEGLRKTNPVEQVRPPRMQAPVQVRLTRAEAAALARAADPVRRDRWAVRLMLCAGLRNQELRSLKGRHLGREGWVWVDRDAGKGGKERWIPITPELEVVAGEIRTLVAADQYVLPGRRRVDPPHGAEMAERPWAMLSAKALAKQVERIGVRAGLAFHLTPHALRHTFAAAAVRTAGDRATQAALGHASIQTTIDTYSGGVSLDELQVSFHGLRLGLPELSTTEHPKEAEDEARAR